ncbi:MAG: bifunctional demethylmenaquinone methyltransferase/2-methoxy-6-polyprenyl-1,4-benzoquinol methylase UbiE [Flavobacteriales bacterium]|nr:bifunctional demethylmenaquinone methyltransferase/2-methoxy-6-polyprenyl-1,4-benzoquinol methylase UbiE [Bacteroidota bacterium]MCB9239998.1 bifunctional demethylmenaquinone methyltransferase/2-methoxy-6-polyprenyl-1,4-benzoquinol methylase UbiE [Flavobacteriales bacterium]
MRKEVKPFSSEGSKSQQVEKMFDEISHRYDFLNHFLSMGIDRSWRRKAIDLLKDIQPKSILDVATGTGDLAIEALRLNPDRIIGVDISEKMLEVGREKMWEHGYKNITLQRGDSMALQFSDGEFDAVTVAFGVRNFENLEKGLREIKRVLRPGGKAVILEFSKPHVFPIKQLFGFYSKYILPLWGKLFSGSEAAYRYLPESVKHFPEGKEMKEILLKCGYKTADFKRLTFGICTVYTAMV